MRSTPRSPEASLDALVEGISHWARIESPTHDAAGVNRCMDEVERDVAGLPIGVERLPGRDALGDMLVLRAGPQAWKPGILMLSHLDTVHPVGTLAGDLPVRIEGDRLYGPGVYDMKGGAYLALQAFKMVAAEGSAGLPLTFLFTSDEEIGSPTSRAVIEDLARASAFALVTEPGRDGGKVVTGRKGVGRFDVHVEGRPSHAGSRHHDGRSAIREAARQILAVEAMTDYDRGVTTTVGMVQGGTAANVIPQHARFCVDLRVVSTQDGDAYAERILKLQPHDADVRVSVTGQMNRPPYEKDEKVAALFAIAHALAKADGYDLLDVPLTGGGSDGNFTAALGVPTLDGLGIDGDGAHTLREFGLIPSIMPRMRLIAGLLRELG